MYLSELRLWNFRKYGSEKPFDLSQPNLIVPFNKGLNVLIGENDSGKTSIIDAIKLVLKTHAYEWIKVEESDFYRGSDKIRIELEFKDIKPNEAKNFIEWLGWEGIGKDATPILRLIYQVEIKQDRIQVTDVKAGMDDTGYPLNAEAREYLKTTYLKALRDADSDLTAKKNSRLSQILKEHEFFKKKSKKDEHPFEKEFKKLNLRIEDWFKTDGNEKLKKIIDDFLVSFTDKEKTSTISLGESDIKSILEKVSLGVLNNQNLGLGTMNRLYMAAELLHLKKENWDGLKLCMIEELEAHLHPQAQMKIIEALQKETEVQFILSTHSPNLASKVKLHNLIFCNNNLALPLGEVPNEENKRTNNDKYTKLDKGDYKFLERFLDVTKSNLFFAKGVILVEGWSEEILLPIIAKKLGYDLTEKEISIVNVGSTAYLKFAKIFLRQNPVEKLNIPVAIITDLDNRPEAKDNSFCTIKKEAKEKKVQEFEKSFNNTKVLLSCTSDWTLEWCLYQSETLSKSFKESVSEIHSGTDEFKAGKFEETKFISKLRKDKGHSPIDKVEVASLLAEKIEKDVLITKENLAKDKKMEYIIKAIKYVCNES
ncbi:ATP-dependent endonuclease [Flavobacterium sp. MDT1-60]|uniref:ATP-dependent nuclease n=1 Tax=Flavobacterium sp. MDT1-60 TaxID=1979344 RepID=UPI00177B3A7C|nr:AAA family ATPase [Flavobacterium sp. MDT1-60]QOG04392.1 AAA family ATPase [Flavobacterium sp. MDT1-60]